MHSFIFFVTIIIIFWYLKWTKYFEMNEIKWKIDNKTAEKIKWLQSTEILRTRYQVLKWNMNHIFDKFHQSRHYMLWFPIPINRLFSGNDVQFIVGMCIMFCWGIGWKPINWSTSIEKVRHEHRNIVMLSMKQLLHVSSRIQRRKTMIQRN